MPKNLTLHFRHNCHVTHNLKLQHCVSALNKSQSAHCTIHISCWCKNIQ